MAEEIRKQEPSSSIECPNCGAIGVQTRYLTDTFKYGAGSDAAELETRIPFRRCPACKFEYTDAEAEDLRHDAICRHLKRMIPAEIAQIRKRYRLRRDEFAAKTRLGEASLARWESGQLIQNGAYDNYLYLLTFRENMRRIEERRTEPDAEDSQTALPSLKNGGKTGFQKQRKSPRHGGRKR